MTGNTNLVDEKLEQIKDEEDSRVTRKSYEVSVSSDAQSALGYYGNCALGADMGIYGKPISVYAKDSGGYPALAMIDGYYAGVTSKKSGKAIVTVTYYKGVTVV